MIAGLDVSHHQRPQSLDYVTLRRRFRFLVARATYGTRVDATFATHITSARRAGFTVGGYHFYRPGQSAAAQMRSFRAQLSVTGAAEPGCVYPTVDLEDSPHDGAWTLARYAPGLDLARALRSLYGGVVVYSRVNLWTLLGNPPLLTEPGVYWWVADYRDRSAPEDVPGVDWTIWQRAPRAVPGAAKIDINAARYVPTIPEIDRERTLGIVGATLAQSARDTMLRRYTESDDHETPITAVRCPKPQR